MIAKSTFAMSAMSLLSAAGGMTRAKLEQAIATHYNLDINVVAPAVSEALQRGLIVPSIGGELSSILPPGYVVVARDRSGDGWSGWVAENHAKQKLEVATLLKGVG